MDNNKQHQTVAAGQGGHPTKEVVGNQVQSQDKTHKVKAKVQAVKAEPVGFVFDQQTHRFKPSEHGHPIKCSEVMGKVIEGSKSHKNLKEYITCVLISAPNHHYSVVNLMDKGDGLSIGKVKKAIPCFKFKDLEKLKAKFSKKGFKTLHSKRLPTKSIEIGA